MKILNENVIERKKFKDFVLNKTSDGKWHTVLDVSRDKYVAVQEAKELNSRITNSDATIEKGKIRLFLEAKNKNDLVRDADKLGMQIPEKSIDDREDFIEETAAIRKLF